MWVNKRVPIFNRINEIKRELQQTDYVCNKLTEAICEYIIQGDNTSVVNVYNEYKEVLAQRKALRDEINALEKELSEVANAESN